MDATSKDANGKARRTMRGLLRVLLALPRAVARLLAGILLILLFAALVIILTNVFIKAPYNVAFRALDPDSPACRSGEPWTVLAEVGNDEGRAIERKFEGGKPVDWEERL